MVTACLMTSAEAHVDFVLTSVLQEFPSIRSPFVSRNSENALEDMSGAGSGV